MLSDMIRRMERVSGIDTNAEAHIAGEVLRAMADEAVVQEFDLTHIFDDAADLQEAMGGVDLAPARIEVAAHSPLDDMQELLLGSDLAPAPRPAVDTARIAAAPRKSYSDLQEVL